MLTFVALILKVFLPFCSIWLASVALKYIIWPPFRNIPGPAALSFLEGNLGQLFHPDGLRFHERCWELYGRVFKVNGLFGAQELYVADPVALHHVLMKEQENFEETKMFTYGSKLILGDGLLSTVGEQHKRQRKILNPIFSFVYLRRMLPIFYGVAYRVCDAIESKVADGPCELDMFLWSSRVALEIVGQAGLGHSFENFEEDNASSYTETVKALEPAWANLAIILQLLPYLMIGPARLRRFIVDLMPFKSVQELRDVADKIEQTSQDILAEKRRAILTGEGKSSVLEREDYQDNNIIGVLLKATRNAPPDGAWILSEREIIGQMSTLVATAFDTTACALSRILFELACDQDVQARLRTEIMESRAKHGEINYEQLESLAYLEAVCRETLRLHSPVSQTRRSACKDTVLPLSQPLQGIDGSVIRQVFVPAGTNITLGILAINRDPIIWGADADRWRPERWLTSLPDTVLDARVPGVYSNQMTFLAGGRSCVGYKFAQLELKVMLSLLLEHFSFSPAKTDVAWYLGATQYPSALKEHIQHASMPLLVSPLRT